MADVMKTEGSRIIRPLAALALTAILGSACGGSPEVFAAGQSQQRDAGAAFDELTLPEPIAAVPAFAVEARKSFSKADLSALTKIRSVATIAPVTVFNSKVRTRKSAASLKVAALNPMEFRSVAPPATRTADFVWFALIGGDVVLTQDASKQLKLGNSTAVSTSRFGKARVGALADNGTPNFADALVSSELVEDAGAPNLVVVGAKSGISLNELARAIRAKVPGARLRWLLPKTETIAVQQAVTTTAGAVSTSSVGGLHPTLAQAVGALINASGGKVWLVSGFRSTAHQYELWVQALQKYGSPEKADNWVAPPGSSFHERGWAVDLGGDLDLAVRLIQEMQLPLWRPMSWEPWHFELLGSRG